MINLKNNKGITLTALVITIIVLIIVAGVSIYSGTNSIDTAGEQIMLSELEQIKHFVGEAYINYKKTQNVNYLVGTKITDEQAKSLATSIEVNLISIPDSYNTDEKAYYRLTPSELEKLGVKNSKSTYVVNYLTGEVINETVKKTKSGEALYTYLRKSFNNTDVTSF